MERKKFNAVSELKEFIDSVGDESDTLEWKDYNMVTVWENERDDIIKALCGLANNKGGVFVIGVTKEREEQAKIVYAKNVDYNDFTEKLDNWVNSLIEPKGIKYRPDRVSDENGQYCIVVFVEPTSGTCYAQKIKNGYLFPYRTYGSTRYYHFEEFFKIYVHKFLRDVAVSGERLRREEEEKMPPIRIAGLEEEPFKSELVNNYIDMLRTIKPSSKNVNRLLQPLRNEAYKVYSKREVNKEDLLAIENLVRFIYEFMKDKNKDIVVKILDILYLLTRAPESTQLVRKICYDYFKELYETGERYDDLVKILDTCGYFGDRIAEIMRAIDNRDQKLLDILTSRLDFIAIRERKYKIIKDLYLKIENLDPEKDKRILDEIEHLIGQLEIA